MTTGSRSSSSRSGRGALMSVALLVAACGGNRDATNAVASTPMATGARPVGEAGAPVVRPADFDLQACLQAARDPATAGPETCPGYVLDSLVYAVEECARVGGMLKPASAPVLRALDIDADGGDEVLYDFTENYYCEGAPSIFSCGSGGCPTGLYAKRDGAWMVLGSINAEDSPGIELLAAPVGARYATLRGGCSGTRPCGEITQYTWNGTGYDRTLIEVGATMVDVAPGGMQTLLADTGVRAAPTPDAPVLDTYPAGRDFVVIGTARGTDYFYVSPCNACQRGFVPADTLRR